MNAKIKQCNEQSKKLIKLLMEGKGVELMKKYFTGNAFVSCKYENGKYIYIYF